MHISLQMNSFKIIIKEIFLRLVPYGVAAAFLRKQSW